MKIIIADDSAVVRAILEQNLKNYPHISIISSVSNGKRLIHAAKESLPDAVIADSDMPEIEGSHSLVSISKQLGVPILILTESKAEISQKFSYSVGFIEKPALNSYKKEFFDSLVEKLKELTENSQKKDSSSTEKAFSGNTTDFKILCLGASTGGPSAVSDVLKGLGKDFPLPILYAQHIEIGADKTMADWFGSVCPNIRIKLAEDGEEAKAGTVYMAPADKHLVIEYVKPSGNPVLSLSSEEPERFLRPAVNKLFRSAAKLYGKNCLALLLTGMGQDGAEGCKMILDKGGYTIVEDKSTCVVFGMPLAAIEAGGAKEILPRPKIPNRVNELVRKDGNK